MNYIRKMVFAIFTTIICIMAINTAHASTATLKLGSSGTEVKILQMNLNGLGYEVDRVDGIYGTDTESAVKRFQTANRLTADGIAGSLTLGEIYTIVADIQNDLNSLGYSVGTADGMYGTATKNAVIAFQTAYGLSADGIAGTQTRTKLANLSTAVISSFSNTASNVRTYSNKTDGNTSLSENFRVKEFASGDGADKVLIDDKLVALLQDIREYFGKPVIINSAYRSYAHNQSQGGSSNSLHLYGMAADIKIDSITPLEIAKYAESLGVKGIGLYKTFVHVDTRTVKYYWNSIGTTTVVSSFK